jgi:hypothetical protein
MSPARPSPLLLCILSLPRAFVAFHRRLARSSKQRASSCSKTRRPTRVCGQTFNAPRAVRYPFFVCLVCVTWVCSPFTGEPWAGGVTSSSLEVLCALALNDEEFRLHMTTAPGGKPADVSAASRGQKQADGCGCPRARPAPSLLWCVCVKVCPSYLLHMPGPRLLQGVRGRGAVNH